MNIGRAVSRTATRWPSNTAIVQGDRQITYREWTEMIDRLTAGLEDIGIGPDSVVATFTHNGIEQVTTYVAVQQLGAVLVPLNHRLSAGELTHILNTAGVELVVYDPTLIDTLEAAMDSIESVQAFIGIGQDPPLGQPFETCLNDNRRDYSDRDTDPSDPCIMMHTSGTTGLPKLVITDHLGQRLNTLAVGFELGFKSTDRVLHIAPLYHSADYLQMFLPAIHVGATNVILPQFDPEEAMKLIDRESITVTLGVPTHFQLFREINVEPYDTTSLRAVVTSGASLSDDIVAWVRSNLHPQFINVYGLTETTGLVTILEPEHFERMEYGYCIGKPFMDMDVRVIELNDDAQPTDIVDDGVEGQLITRGSKIMQGYYRLPEKTAETIKQGWLYTGDVAIRDEDGFYYLVDRLNNMIVSGGENIYPMAVERVLDKHPGVEESAVVGRPDPTFGERVVAFIIAADADLTDSDLDRYWLESQQELADFKRPREYHFIDTIPKNPSGKIQRHLLPDSNE